MLLAWENEAFLPIKELGPDKVDIVVPSLSILAEPSVAVIDKVTLHRGTREIAQAYLEYLYSPACAPTNSIFTVIRHTECAFVFDQAFTPFIQVRVIGGEVLAEGFIRAA